MEDADAKVQVCKKAADSFALSSFLQKTDVNGDGYVDVADMVGVRQVVYALQYGS
jgi:hypothetical protein